MVDVDFEFIVELAKCFRELFGELAERQGLQWCAAGLRVTEPRVAATPRNGYSLSSHYCVGVYGSILLRAHTTWRHVQPHGPGRLLPHESPSDGGPSGADPGLRCDGLRARAQQVLLCSLQGVFGVPVPGDPEKKRSELPVHETVQSSPVLSADRTSETGFHPAGGYCTLSENRSVSIPSEDHVSEKC